MRRRLVVILLITATAASCESGGSSPSEYRAQVRKVCDHYRREAKAIPEPGPGAASLAAYERRSDRLFRKQLADLTAIEPPPSERRLVRRWLAAGRELAAFSGRQTAVLNRDQRRFEREIKHLKIPHHKPTAEELAHPTAAILNEVYRYSPAFRRFMRDSRTLVLRSKPLVERFASIAARLRVSGCLG